MQHSSRIRKWSVAVAFAALGVSTSSPARAEAPDGVRIAAEAGGGVLGGAGGGLVGLGFGAMTCKGGLECIGAGILGAATGAIAGVGLGTWAGGTLADGNGGIGLTYLGELGGLLTLAIGIGIHHEAELDLPDLLDALFIVGLPVAGAVIGYEISHEPQEGTASASAPLFVTLPIAF